MGWIDTPSDVNKAGRYYRLLVVAQVMLLFGVLCLLSFAPERNPPIRIRAAVSDLNGGLKTALERFKVEYGRYPSTAEGLNLLVQSPTDGTQTNWHGPYLDGVPTDPWGHPYAYRFPGVYSTNGYDVYSLGPDGISVTGGNDPDDIGNWDKPQQGSGVDDELLFEKVQALPLVIPLLFAIRVIAAMVSRRFRAVIEGNRVADRVWTAMVVLIVIFILFMPKFSEIG